ncbi:MAG TPA: hypothetical protein VIF82_03955 [Burkholderiaceae bacterium]
MTRMHCIISGIDFRIDAASDKLRALMSPYKPYHVHPLSPEMRFFFEVEIGIAVFILIAYAVYLEIKQWRSKRPGLKKNDAPRSKRHHKRRRR